MVREQKGRIPAGRPTMPCPTSETKYLHRATPHQAALQETDVASTRTRGRLMCFMPPRKIGVALDEWTGATARHMQMGDRFDHAGNM